MRKTIIISLLLLFFKLSIANEVDRLQTQEDVQKFLIEKVDTTWKHENIFDAKMYDTSKFGKNKFFKIDIDNDGLTDLVINGTTFLVVIANGDSGYISHYIDEGHFRFENYTLANIMYSNNIPLLVIRGYGEYGQQHKDLKTLIYKFGDFIEYNPQPNDLRIEKIVHSYRGGFWIRGGSDLAIYASRIAVLDEIEHSGKKTRYSTTIDTTSYRQLVATINYLQFPLLQDNYEAVGTDLSSSFLEIVYNNGQTKKIDDYGETGTFGLQNLYRQLYLLKRTQTWK